MMIIEIDVFSGNALGVWIKKIFTPRLHATLNIMWQNDYNNAMYNLPK